MYNLCELILAFLLFVYIYKLAKNMLQDILNKNTTHLGIFWNLGL